MTEQVQSIQKHFDDVLSDENIEDILVKASGVIEEKDGIELF